MSNEIPVWVTITRINGQIFPQVFGGIHEITDNEFVVGTEWTYVSRRQGNMGETFYCIVLIKFLSKLKKLIIVRVI